MLSLLARSLLLSHAGALLLENSAIDERQNPAALDAPRPYNVLVFGDSWATIGPTWRVIRDVLAQHNVNAKVASTAVAGTTSCQWATVSSNMVAAGRRHFGHEPVDFAWLTLGGNDLLLPSYVTCSHRARTQEQAEKCLLEVARQSVRCNLKLLTTFWAKYPKAKVVQNAYDYECAGPKCLPSARFPWCKSDVTCINTMATFWGHALLDGINATWDDDRYKSIRMDGACQVAGNYPGAQIGDPNMTMGSPCEYMVGCEHPAPNSKAAFLIGEGFWTKFFRGRAVPVSEEIWGKERAVIEQPNPLWSEMTNLTEYNFECNKNWIPNLENDEPLNPPCNVGVWSPSEP